MKNSHNIGKEFEAHAAVFLKKLGYKVLEKNFRTRYGEIDLIAKDGKDMVFVEVKYRRSVSHGVPGEFVNTIKQKRIINSAMVYAKIKNTKNINYRFDVVLMDDGAVEHIKSAYCAPSRYL